MNLTWKNILLTIREGKHLIPTTDDGTPLVAVNAPLFELMELLEALTSGYNDLVAENTIKGKRIEFLRKAADAHFQNAKTTKNTYHWVRVSERLPEKSGDYYTYGTNLGVYNLSYSAKHKLWNTHDQCTPDEAMENAITVTHWCEKPNAPDDTASADPVPTDPIADEED
jgi:hypothetical protein